MALLTNPNTGDGKFTKFLLTNKGFICVIVYCLGISWFVSLAHRTFNDGTYFSENALLPGLVQAGFDEDLTAKKLFLELRDVMQSNPNEIPFEWLKQKFTEINIDAYLHSFSVSYPLVNNMTYYGKNVYGILRAPRASSTEGLIVTAPFRTLDNPDLNCTASIALLFALAKYCRKHKFWAKDLIFLITDHEQLGTQAWLQAYHNIQLGNGVLNHGNIVARAGSIQAAINLEIHSTKISHIDVKVEGLNGQLPNLDLVNLVHKLCKDEGIQHTFKNRNNPRRKDLAIHQWYHSLITLFSMVWTQASCVPNGNHGLYHRFGIEAVTLEGFEPASGSRKPVAGFSELGRVLEGILRSLNNLLERFHQSYFFYLLTSNDRFIPIGSYMPSVSLVGAPLLIKGLTIWLKLYNHFKPKTDGTNSVKRDNNSVKKLKDNQRNLSFYGIGIILFLSHLCGWLFTYSGVWFSKMGLAYINLPTKSSIYIGFFILFIMSLSITHFLKFNQIELDILNIVALLELATLLLIIAMHNFSLSLVLSIVFVPSVCFASYGSGKLKRIVSSIFMLLIHPFILLHLIVLGYTYITQGERDLFAKAFSATQHSFVYLIVDEMVYGNWLIKVVFGFFIPNWILFWTYLHS